MPRLQLHPPERFGFETAVQIYISHVNQGGHLDNAQLITLVSEARLRFFRALGWREGDVLLSAERCDTGVAAAA